ncbi:putative extensin [Iris pallida]|uniref:Extensin n=1 Tax=Iris pallida TaxID=29817 RepID=A0AAX6G2R6_IRIPA|nr:putative extensin [Iris pallida]
MVLVMWVGLVARHGGAGGGLVMQVRMMVVVKMMTAMVAEMRFCCRVWWLVTVMVAAGAWDGRGDDGSGSNGRADIGKAEGLMGTYDWW